MQQFVIIILLVLGPCLMTGQIPLDPNVGTTVDTSSTVPDSIVIRNGILDVFEGNPGKAAVRGLLLPAGGQIYNRRWWKVPLALALEGATIGYLMYSYDQYGSWNQEYISVVINGNEPQKGITSGDQILQQRNQWRSRREMGWVIFAVGHIFTAFEAYIDRHLQEFDVSDDLTFVPISSLMGPVPSLTYSIPLHTSKYKTVTKHTTWP